MINYPRYFKTIDTFAYNKSFTSLFYMMNQVKKAFKNNSLLANFIDNHDNDRFLSKNPDTTILKNALLFTLFSEGIPVIYYGTEQMFKGKGDPGAREVFFNSFNTSSPIFQWLKTTITVRKQHKVSPPWLIIDLGP